MKLVAAITAVTAGLMLILPAGLAQDRRDSEERRGDARIQRLEVVDAGFYTARKTGEARVAPGAAAGADQMLAGVEFLKEPPANTASVGTQFGVRFRSVGRPSDAEVTLRSVWKIPAPGITNPKNNNTYRQSVVEFMHIIGTTHMRGYGFDAPWEIVRGTWTLEVWHGDRKLLEENFEIK